MNEFKTSLKELIYTKKLLSDNSIISYSQQMEILNKIESDKLNKELNEYLTNLDKKIYELQKRNAPTPPVTINPETSASKNTASGGQN